MTMLVDRNPEAPSTPRRECCFTRCLGLVALLNPITEEHIAGYVPVHKAVTMVNVLPHPKRVKTILRDNLLIGHTPTAILRLHTMFLLHSPLVNEFIRVYWRSSNLPYVGIVELFPYLGELLTCTKHLMTQYHLSTYSLSF